ncbi:hypothetical protein H312_00809 [Anncaliia algerae PRA339]|uniref:Uncharacterized protein n=1 Tax=Anncaliia algerae PRA339 TaxID=1288291 RepID=A0A059F445_9MICR|nr:hypothetical protein H312_00809 [Anncaliia algerae PRA339]
MIEGTWNGLKQVTPSRCRTVAKIDDCICSFIWRRKNEQNDIWLEFIKVLSLYFIFFSNLKFWDLNLQLL